MAEIEVRVLIKGLVLERSRHIPIREEKAELNRHSEVKKRTFKHFSPDSIYLLI